MDVCVHWRRAHVTTWSRDDVVTWHCQQGRNFGTHVCRRRTSKHTSKRSLVSLTELRRFVYLSAAHWLERSLGANKNRKGLIETLQKHGFCLTNLETKSDCNFPPKLSTTDVFLRRRSSGDIENFSNLKTFNLKKITLHNTRFSLGALTRYEDRSDKRFEAASLVTEQDR